MAEEAAKQAGFRPARQPPYAGTEPSVVVADAFSGESAIPEHAETVCGC
jgi:hypothetical protein